MTERVLSSLVSQAPLRRYGLFVTTLPPGGGARGGNLDMLFVDGDHRYEGVLVDWLLYNHLVSPGGLIAFHDAVAGISHAGVPKLLEQLSAGIIDGVKRDIKRIVYSKDCGIAYYVHAERA